MIEEYKDAALLTKDGNFTRVRVRDYRDMNKYIGSSYMELAYITPDGLDVFCDEEFLLKGFGEETLNPWCERFVEMGYHGNPPYGLHGNLLVLRSNDEGYGESLREEDFGGLELIAPAQFTEKHISTE